MLKIEGLYKTFKDKKVLEGLDLVLNEGSIFGLVGVNGAGKSTLLRCIAGIYEADHGSVLFNGEDTFKNPAVRKDIFFVSDEPYYPIAANIRTMKEFYSSFYDVDMKTYNEVLNLFHLDDTKPISSLSKGMKRQASLLFALSIAPKLLLLDEAFPMAFWKTAGSLPMAIFWNPRPISINTSWPLLRQSMNRYLTHSTSFIHGKKALSIPLSYAATDSRSKKNCKNLIRSFLILCRSILKSSLFMNMKEEANDVFQGIL